MRLIIEGNHLVNGIEKTAGAYVAMPEGATWDVVADHDIAFHRSLLTASASPRLLRTFNSVSAGLRLLIAQLRPAYRGASQIAAEHTVLLAPCAPARSAPPWKRGKNNLDAAERFFLDLIKENGP